MELFDSLHVRMAYPRHRCEVCRGTFQWQVAGMRGLVRLQGEKKNGELTMKVVLFCGGTGMLYDTRYGA